MDATFGLGYTAGPALGSLLYSLGGFPAPFLACGLAAAGTGALCVWRCVPPGSPEGDQPAPCSPLPLLLSPGVLLSLASVAAAAVSVSYVESLLALYLATFALSVTHIGLCFLALAVMYTLGRTHQKKLDR